jgi:hypothetical protein
MSTATATRRNGDQPFIISRTFDAPCHGHRPLRRAIDDEPHLPRRAPESGLKRMAAVNGTLFATDRGAAPGIPGAITTRTARRPATRRDQP